VNERIKQLALQAGWDLWEGRAQADMTGCETELQKFAELIVAECLKIAKNREDEFESAGFLEESNAVGNVAYQISRQFGVER